MDKDTVQKKAEELRVILSQYEKELGVLEENLYQAVSDYQGALSQEKIKEIKEGIQ